MKFLPLFLVLTLAAFGQAGLRSPALVATLHARGAAAPAFSPSSITWSLALNADSLGYLSNGADVTGWTNPYNAAIYATPPGTAPKKRTYTTVNSAGSVATYPVVEFVGSDYLSASGIADATFDTNIILFLVSQSDAGANRFVFSASGFTFGIAEQGGSDPSINEWFGVVQNYAWSQVQVFRYNGVTVSLTSDLRRQTGSAKTDSLGLSGAIGIGATSSGGFGFAGYVRAVYLAHSTDVSPAQATNMVTWLATNCPGFARTNSLVFVGDSLTAGVGGSTSYWQRVTNELRASGYQYHYAWTDAASGTTLTNMQDRYTNVLQYVAPPKLSSIDVAILWGGQNDIGLGATASATIDKLTNYCNTIRTNGTKVAVLTITPNATDDAGRIAIKSTVNAFIRTNVFIDRPIDVVADARLQDATNGTYFDDGLHLTQAGYDIAAHIVATNLTNPWP